MAPERRKLAAIMFTDIAGFSRQMGADEPRMLRVLEVHNQLIQHAVTDHQGHVIKTMGDGFLVDFPSVVNAVQCAQQIQSQLHAYNAKTDKTEQIHVRIGIHLGDIMQREGDVFGDGVNIASRLQTLAEPDTICLSDVVYRDVAKKLDLGTVVSLGRPKLKNIAERFQVYTLLTEAPQGLRQQLQVQRLKLEYFSDGITEDITADLSKISSLFVIARNSAFFYKGKAVKMQDLSKELGVRYVLEGSVRKAGEQVRITAQLVDGTTGGHLWTERYDRPLADIFTLQDEIRQKIVLALKVKLTPEEQERFKRAPTNSLEAYDSYLRGWEAWTRAYYETKKEANIQARQMMERALALDPTYAAAYAGLGSTYFLEWFLQWNPDRAQSLDRALEMAQKAVVLDDSLPGAHQTLGSIYTFKRQHDQAVVEAERAIALAPNDANGYETLGWILTYVGRPEEGIELIEKAMRLNPRPPVFYIRSLGWAYRVAGRYEEALVPLKKFLTLNPNNVPVRLNLAACYAELGRIEEARAEVAEALRLNPTFSLEQAKQIYPFKDPADLERFLASWRKAGLK
ncbi:MAG: adenylate/guanylate cyclase domain-containing protein [Deltaproteobacteria bacterium]|nr:adenylate/guanylate cyclase domain-containing protein [Deltaproteobacteria bacterium]